MTASPVYGYSEVRARGTEAAARIADLPPCDVCQQPSPYSFAPPREGLYLESECMNACKEHRSDVRLVWSKRHG